MTNLIVQNNVFRALNYLQIKYLALKDLSSIFTLTYLREIKKKNLMAWYGK